MLRRGVPHVSNRAPWTRFTARAGSQCGRAATRAGPTRPRCDDSEPAQRLDPAATMCDGGPGPAGPARCRGALAGLVLAHVDSDSRAAARARHGYWTPVCRGAQRLEVGLVAALVLPLHAPWAGQPGRTPGPERLGPEGCYAAYDYRSMRGLAGTRLRAARGPRRAGAAWAFPLTRVLN